MLSSLGILIGGLGLFLLAVRMITDGLKLAAGDALRDFLARSTATRLRGVVSGIAVTGIVQSSSAVTVATIGFVNAGLLTLTQAMSIVFGANIGTTLTGWLVSLVGFNLRLEIFALPLLGIGMFAMTLFQKRGRLGAIGEALAGFGLFFIGIDFLREAFIGVSSVLELQDIQSAGIGGTLLFLGFGFLMTMMTQSSSAAIALVLTAASSGIIGLSAAAAVVIGVNLGTTSTAAFAVIGATANARRVAAAHVVFNLITACVALLLLPVLLALVRVTGGLLQLADIPSVTLALFHTTFNVLGVVLIWPFTDRLATFLSKRFRTQAETLGQARYLDRNVLVAPVLALEALKQEIQHLVQLAHDYAGLALGSTRPAPARLHVQQQALTDLFGVMENFIAQLEAERLTDHTSRQLALVLRIHNYVSEISDLLEEIAVRDRYLESGHAKTPGPEVIVYVEHIRSLLGELAKLEYGSELDRGTELEALRTQVQALETQWRQLKTTILEAAAGKRVSIQRLNTSIDSLRQMRRLCERFLKISERLQELISNEAPEPQPPAPESPDKPTQDPAG